jgi:hypothetical protein
MLHAVTWERPPTAQPQHCCEHAPVCWQVSALAENDVVHLCRHLSQADHSGQLGHNKSGCRYFSHGRPRQLQPQVAASCRQSQLQLPALSLAFNHIPHILASTSAIAEPTHGCTTNRQCL